MKQALVCGAGGFIASHIVKRLKREGYWVRGVDLKYPEFAETAADDFVVGDLRDQDVCAAVVDRRFDEVYQLAADMGGAGYIFTGEHDADVMHNSATINLIGYHCNLTVPQRTRSRCKNSERYEKAMITAKEMSQNRPQPTTSTV
ncbi:MAG TPA: NAD-dependent epimerase/dehydratase family protein, partial [Rhizomicrobium sp.]|nr:NAD-dependent epimerase/dehydratase family protein [Rhizomicrobium sp.]